jgi:hypothetical protein
MATSPAQQGFRDYQKDIHEMTKHIVHAIKSGELYTTDILVSFYQDIANMWIEYFEENEFNMELWQGRIEDYVIRQSNELAARFNLPQSIPDEPPPEPGEGSSVDELFGFPIITSTFCEAQGARVRGQILLTLEELAEYIEPIPAGAIRGIIVVQDSKGKVTGFSVCAHKNS